MNFRSRMISNPVAKVLSIMMILVFTSCGENGISKFITATMTPAITRTIPPPRINKPTNQKATTWISPTKLDIPTITTTPISTNPVVRPHSGEIHDIAIDPTKSATLFVGSNGGVFKSIDGGEHWNAKNNGLPDCEIVEVAIDPITPTTLYAGTSKQNIYKGECGVWKSIDGGESWIGINNGLPSVYIHSLVINPVTPDTLYLGMSDGVFKSEDGGGSWNAITTLPYDNNYELAISTASPSTLYAWSYRKGLFASNDDGASWIELSIGLTNTEFFILAINPLNPDTLYAGTHHGVIKSTNGGETWTEINHGLPDIGFYTLAIDPVTPDTVYAVDADYVGYSWKTRLYKSTDGGVNWSNANTILEDKNIITLAIDPNIPSTVYAGTSYGGIYQSTNGGEDWGTASIGLDTPNVFSLAIDPANPTILYAGTFSAYEGASIFKTTDSGNNWQPILFDIGYSGFRLLIDPAVTTTLYATTEGGLLKSVNGGGEWQPTNTGLHQKNVCALAIDPVKTTTLYAGTMGGGIFISTDGGKYWNEMNKGVTEGYICSLVIDPLTPTNMYAGSVRGWTGIFKSTNGGASWRTSVSGLPQIQKDIYTLVIDPVTPSTLYASVNGWEIWGVYKSIDSGENWNAIYAGKNHPRFNSIVISPKDSNILYGGVGSYDGSVIKSTDGGFKWFKANNGMPIIGVNILVMDPKNPAILFAGTSNGVYMSADGGEKWTAINTGL